jgi:hypothetical protein
VVGSEEALFVAVFEDVFFDLTLLDFIGITSSGSTAFSRTICDAGLSSRSAMNAG